MPRPSPPTPEVQAAFLAGLRGGALVEAAAARAAAAGHRRERVRQWAGAGR